MVEGDEQQQENQNEEVDQDLLEENRVTVQNVEDQSNTEVIKPERIENEDGVLVQQHSQSEVFSPTQKLIDVREKEVEKTDKDILDHIEKRFPG